MDLNLFLIASIILLILMMLGMLGGSDKIDIIWAMFPALGLIVGIYFGAALLSDGSLTQLSGSTTNVIASASTSGSSPWQFIELIPIILTLGCAGMSMYKTVKVMR